MLYGFARGRCVALTWRRGFGVDEEADKQDCRGRQKCEDVTTVFKVKTGICGVDCSKECINKGM